MTFIAQLEKAQETNNSLLCVGLDPVMEKVPKRFLSASLPYYDFCRDIVLQTHDYVSAYKPNLAFFAAGGSEGIAQLQKVIKFIHEKTEIPVILDAKLADIGHTSEAYATFVFDVLKADAVTLNPYLGQTAIQPFLDRKDKGCILLCRTSNEGAEEFQELHVGMYMPLWEQVATNVVEKWNAHGNCMLVVGVSADQGSTAEELKEIRSIVKDMPLLIPGVGAQGGDVEAIIKSGLNSKKSGLMINTSRGVIYAEKPGEEAEKLNQEISKYRK